MQRGGLAEHLNGRIVEADLVVLDRVAVYADGQLEVLVPDDIGGTGEVLDVLGVAAAIRDEGYAAASMPAASAAALAVADDLGQADDACI